jgi:hypothetical protein
MFLVFLALSQAATSITLQGTKEPRPAAPWTRTTSGTCGNQTVEVRQPVYPLGGRASLWVNGLPVHRNLGEAQQDLSDVRSAYRITVQCSRESRNIEVRWVRGRRDSHDHVSYRAGRITLSGSTVISFASENSNADTFWF